MGDRFYGSPDLITWCADNGWDWRLRLKGGLLVHDRDGGETTVAECFERGERLLARLQRFEGWTMANTLNFLG
jgi:hypothetical protein